MSHFSSKVLNRVHHIEAPQVITQQANSEFESLCSTWCNLDVDIHILDFKHLVKLDSSFYKAYSKFQNQTKKNQAVVTTLNLNESISRQIKTDGKDNIFTSSMSPPESSSNSSAEDRQVILKQVVRELVAATRASMETLFNTTVAVDENYRENYKNLNLLVFIGYLT